MRLKLDENMPADARAMVEDLGHDVDTAVNEGMAGAADDDVIASARSEGRFLVTLDRGMGDIRRHPPGSHAGLVVLRVGDQRSPAVLEALRTFLLNHDLPDFVGCTVVVHGHLVRVRRPNED